MPKPRRQRPDKTEAGKPDLKPIVAERIISALRTTPLGVVLIAGIAYLLLGSLPLPLVSAIPALSYVTVIFGLAITLCFNRSRAFFVLLTILLSQLSLSADVPEYLDREFVIHGIDSIVSLLLPVNFLFLASMTERGIASRSGRRYFLFIFFQVIFITGVVFSGDKGLFMELDKQFIGWSIRTPIPDTAMIAFIMTGLLLLARRRRTNTHFKTAMLGALVAIAFARHFSGMPATMSLFYTTAGFIIIVYVIQDYYFKAYLDELTALPSRRSLNEAMLGLEGSYVIAMVDVDFFKKFNDTYGHDAGDDVLRFIARIMKDFQAVKPFRYGGEEFTILLPGQSIKEALPLLDELRAQIASSVFVLRGGGKRASERKLHVTVSIGMAESTPKLKTPEEVIKAADAALYRAKEGGRNCVCS